MKKLALLVMAAAVLFASNSYAHDWWGRGHSSTPQEAYLRGLGCYLDSVGRYHWHSSLALRNYQDAVSQSYDNYLKRVETRFEARLLNRQYRAELDPYKPFNKEEYLAMHEKFKSKDVEPGIHYNGNVYRTYKDFKCSKDYLLMIQERDQRLLHDEILEDLNKEVLKENYEAEWRRRNTPQHLLDRQEKANRLRRLGYLN